MPSLGTGDRQWAGFQHQGTWVLWYRLEQQGRAYSISWWERINLKEAPSLLSHCLVFKVVSLMFLHQLLNKHHVSTWLKIVEKTPFWRLLCKVDVPLATTSHASHQCTAFPMVAGHILRFPGSILHLLIQLLGPRVMAIQASDPLTCSDWVFTKHFLSPYTAPRERGLQSHEWVRYLHQLHRSLHDTEDEKVRHPKKTKHPGWRLY